MAGVQRSISPSSLRALAARTSGGLIVSAGIGAAGLVGVPAASYVNDKFLGGKPGEAPFLVSIATSAAIGGVFGAAAGALFPHIAIRQPTQIVTALDQAANAAKGTSNVTSHLDEIRTLASAKTVDTASILKAVGQAQSTVDNNLPLTREAIKIARKAAASPTRLVAALDQARTGAMRTSVVSGAVTLAVDSMYDLIRPDAPPVDPGGDDGGYLGAGN